jgi:hypothetical protein
MIIFIIGFVDAKKQLFSAECCGRWWGLSDKKPGV